MLELCIANNSGINAVEERELWIPGDNNLPPKRNFWQVTKLIKYFLYPLHRRSGGQDSTGTAGRTLPLERRCGGAGQVAGNATPVL